MRAARPAGAVRADAGSGADGGVHAREGEGYYEREQEFEVSLKAEAFALAA